ncbi:hypothetical protein [Tessaracoccus sp. Z1128]
MIWVAVVGGIALLGLAALAAYAVTLKHKADDVMAEVAVVAERAAEMSDLIGQVRLAHHVRD